MKCNGFMVSNAFMACNVRDLGKIKAKKRQDHEKKKLNNLTFLQVSFCKLICRIVKLRIS